MSKIYAVQGDSLPPVTLTITDLDDNLHRGERLQLDLAGQGFVRTA